MALFVGECRRCGAQHMSFLVYGVSTVVEKKSIRYAAGRTRLYREVELACRCHECRRTTIFTLSAEASSLSELPKLTFDSHENPTSLGYRVLSAFPENQAKPTPDHTPEPAASFFNQAATAIANGSYDAAGAMFRKCLESVSRNEKLTLLIPKERRDEFNKSWLKKRITILKEVHAIPPALGDLVDVIKEEGDGAVHEDVLYDQEDAAALQQFTETFLEQTFTIPAQIERIRAKKSPEEPG